jgi:hypothetical protein
VRVGSADLFDIKESYTVRIYPQLYPVGTYSKAPKEERKIICEEAVDALKVLNKCAFKNEDARPTNTIVASSLPDGNRCIVAIDFGRCRFWNAQECSWGSG